MLSREVVECQRRVAVLFQARHRGLMFRFVHFDEHVERLLRFLACAGHPDLMQLVLRVRLKVVGHLVHDVGALMHPAALFARRRPDLPHRCPEAQRPVGDGKLGIAPASPQSAVLQVHDHAGPRLFALADARLHRAQFLGAIGLRAHQHQHADAGIRRFLQANIGVDAVGPDIHVLLVRQVAA